MAYGGAYVELDREGDAWLKLPSSSLSSIVCRCLSLSLSLSTRPRPSVLQPVECAQVPPSIHSFFSKREELETVGWSGMGWDCL